MRKDGNDKQIIKISILTTSIFVIFISVAYAFMNQTVTGTKKQVITAGNLELEFKEGDAITLENALPMYDEVGMIQDSYDFTLKNKTSENTKYTLKLKDVAGENTQKLDTTLVKYGFTKDEVVTKDFLSNLKNNVLDSGTIKGNQMIRYSLRLWIDYTVEDEVQIKGKSLSYQIEVGVVQDIIKDSNSAEVKLFTSDNLGENCETYDDGVDTFLVGQCNQNYVWYSGKLWRVVLKNNETGAVKIVTDNAITVIGYNEQDNITFENSYADQWLTQEFLPTLHDYEDYLVEDSIWDATLDGSDTPNRPTGATPVTRTVGLLNAYEYYTTYNNSDGLTTSGTGYLKNGVHWWLITPNSTSEIYAVNSLGNLIRTLLDYTFGVRPSVNLKSDIRITSGNGTESNPYRLEGDSQETLNGITLLSTRHSGEYITFNNALYRIADIENNSTKIIAVDRPVELLSKAFDSNASNVVSSFEKASIKTDLENYYQNNIAESYKSMIDLNQTWYLGAVSRGTNYKASICKTVNMEIGTSLCERTDAIAIANIGLPRVGEMFTSQISRKAYVDFWILTSGAQNYCLGSTGGFAQRHPGSKDIGVRPSMYLKSNVVISSTNTGDGTYEHPYTIELVK